LKKRKCNLLNTALNKKKALDLSAFFIGMDILKVKVFSALY